MYRILQGLHENALIGRLIMSYNWEEVEQICDYHPELMKSILKNSNTPLHELCLIGSSPSHLLKKVLNCWHEATITRNRWGETPLHAKCRCSQYSLYPVKLLIETNPSALKMVNDTGKTPLAIACLHGASVSVVKELVSAYPEALYMKDINDHTPIDLLWSSFAKTIPGAFAISKYLTKKIRPETRYWTNPCPLPEDHEEMSGVLARFYEKMSFCLNQFRILSKKLSTTMDNRSNDYFESLLTHTIIEANLRHCPHTLLDIFLTRDENFGTKVDENGNTPLHLLTLKEINYDCVRLLLSKCKGTAAALNSDGQLPLHLVLKSNMKEKNDSFEKAVLEIMKAYTYALDVRDPETLLYPFMASAVMGKLDLSYKFLLESPNTVLPLMQVGFINQ